MKADFRGLVLQAQGLQHLGERVITTAVEAVIQPNDFTLAVRLTTPAPVTIPLPSPANLPAEPGSVRLRIRDAAGNAGTYPITISGSGALILGNPTLVIGADRGSVEIEWTGAEWTVWGGGNSSTGNFYAPAVPGDWQPPVSTNPSTPLNVVLDQIGARLTALEASMNQHPKTPNPLPVELLDTTTPIFTTDNPNRLGFVIYNQSKDHTAMIVLGSTADDTTDAIPVAPQGRYTDKTGWQGPVCGRSLLDGAPDGTCDIVATELLP